MTESEILENENLVKVDPGLRLDHVVGQAEAVAQLRDLCRRIQWPQVYSAWGVSKPKAIALVGPPGAGKAQPLDSIVYTPLGPTRMGDLQVGDFVLTPEGGKARILEIYPQGVKSVYSVKFSDDSSAECCLEHLWATQSDLDRKAGRPAAVRQTSALIKSLRYTNNRRNHSIRVSSPLCFNKRVLPIEPYVFGLLLGDGCFRGGSLTYSSVDEELIEEVRNAAAVFDCDLKPIPDSCDFIIRKRSGLYNKFLQEIRKLGLWGKKSEEKVIPEDYLFSSIEDRTGLLQGLMDTDGTIDIRGITPTFDSSSKILAEQVRWLVQSLGGIATMRERQTGGLPSYRVFIQLNGINPFRLTRKAERIRPRVKYAIQRFIDSIEYVGEKEAQCILIDSSEHLYLTDEAIVTHNTFTIRALANEVSCPLMELKYEDVASHLYDEAIKKLNSFKDQATKAAEIHGHVLVMIDEADIFFQSRFDSNVHNSDSKKTNFFLRWIDGDLEGSDNFTIVVASNAWETIDPALRRSGRFTKIEFKALSPTDVVEAVKVHMDLSEKRVGRRLFDRAGIEKLVDVASEVTGADVKELIDSVLLSRANKHLDLLLDGKEDITMVDVGPITIDEVADEMKMQHKKLKPAVRRVGFER